MAEEIRRTEAERFIAQLADQYSVPKPVVLFDCERFCSGPKISGENFLCAMIACCNESLGNRISFKSDTKLTKNLVSHEFGHYLFHVKNPRVCEAYIKKHMHTHPECDALAESMGPTEAMFSNIKPTETYRENVEKPTEAEIPEWQRQIEELRKRFEEVFQSVGAIIIVGGCIASVVIIGVGAYVWFTKGEHHSSHSSSAGFDVSYIDLTTGKRVEKSITEREQYDLYKLQREGKISIISIKPIKG